MTSNLTVGFFFLCFIIFVSCTVRQKRELRFPEGSSFAAAVALTSYFPKGLTDGFAHILEFDLGFPFPKKLAIDKVEKRKGSIKRKKGMKKKFRGKRSLEEEQRDELLSRIKNIIDKIGFNGSACLNRFQCELQLINPENSLLEELLVALFKTNNRTEDCEMSAGMCSVSLLNILLHSERLDIAEGR